MAAVELGKCGVLALEQGSSLHACTYVESLGNGTIKVTS